MISQCSEPKMNEAMLAKLLDHYRKGWISAPEAANKIIYTLVSESRLDSSNVLLMSSTLPNEVKNSLSQQMRSIRDSDYRWVPFLFGVHSEPPDPTEFSDKLRQLDAILVSR